MRKALIDWRDGYASTPRTADYHMTVLKRVLSWAVYEDLVDVNPAEGIKSIHRSTRAALIVPDRDLDRLLPLLTEHARRLVRFAAETGLRREDIVNLKWEHVHEDYVAFATGKSRGRKTVLVPLVAGARTAIQEARAEREAIIASGYVPPPNVFLTPARKRWKPDSVTNAFRRAALNVGLNRSFNDLRGTAITRFVIAGITDEQIADIVGWEVSRVRDIRKHYVDPATIAMGIAAKLEEARKTG